MSQGTPPDPIRSLFEQLKRTSDWLGELIRSRNWSELSLAIATILLIVAAPGFGVAHDSISKIFPKYASVFWTAIALIIGLSFLLKLLKLFSSSRSVLRRWLVFLGTVTIILVLAVLTGQFIHDSKTEPSATSAEVKFSWGEKFLIPEKNPNCISLIGRSPLSEYEKSDYKSAESAYRAYIDVDNDKCKNEPQALIFWNNARAMQAKNPMRIAVSLTISRGKGKREGVDKSNEILRGIAIAQNEWNDEKNEDRKRLFKEGGKLLVGIADDGWGKAERYCGDKLDTGVCQKAQEVANFLVKRNNILGVIAHMGSDVTEAAAKIYEQGKLVAISPTSTAIRVNEKCSENKDALCLNSYIFRVAPDDSIAAENLVKKMYERINKVAIIYERKTKYGRGFKNQFTTNFERDNPKALILNSQGNVDNLCDSSKDKFAAVDCWNTSKQADALLLTSAGKSDKITEILNNDNSTHHLDLLGTDGMYDKVYIKNDKSEAVKKTEGMLIAVPWQRESDFCTHTDTALACRVANLLGRDATLISWRTATVYDATQALLEGLKQTWNQKCSLFGWRIGSGNGCLRRELKDVLLTIKAKGVLGDGEVKFDEKGDRRRSSEEKLGVVVQVQGDGIKPCIDQRCLPLNSPS